jgi:branched-chain amino acid transport system substrate-binding protein
MRTKTTIATLATLGCLMSTAVLADARIVVVGPMSGQFANYWPQIEVAGKAAEAVINENGGVLGGKLTVEYADDACDPKQAVSVANRNVQEGYDAVIGHFCSGSSISASDVYNEEEMLMISGASVNSTLTDRGLPYVFRTVGRDDQQGGAAAEAILSGAYGKKVALVHDKSAFGQGLVDKTKGFLLEGELEPAFEDAITAGENDYSALVTRIVNEGIDVFYFGGYHREAGLLVRQLKEAGFEGGTFISGDGIKAQEFVTIAGDASNGVLFTFFPDARELPAAQKVLPKLKELGSDGDGFTLYIYAAIQAYVDAVNMAGSKDVKAVATALRFGDFSTAVGDLNFNAKGDVDRNLYRMYQWKDGEIAALD